MALKNNNIIVILFVFLIALVSVSYAQIDSIRLKEFKQSKDYKNNIILLESELKKADKPNEYLYQLQSILINNYISVGDYNKALMLCQKGILNAQKNNLPFNEANLYVALARSYYYLNQIDKVVLYNNKGLNIAEKYSYNDVLKRCNHNLGVVAFEQENNYIKAKNYFLKAINYGKVLQQTKESNIGTQLRLLATTYDLLKEYSNADSVFVITENLYKQLGDSLGLSDALTFHARLLLSQKKYDKALLLSGDAIKIARVTNNTEYIQTALSINEQIYSELNNFEKAYQIKNEIFNLLISSSTINQKKEIADAEAKFKVAELQNKQDLLELQAKQSKRNYIFVFIILTVILLSILFLVYQKRLAQHEQKIKVESVKQIYEAEENERTRIAKDLHDNMGSYTTSILSQIDMIELYDATEQKLKIKELREDAESIMATLRETIWILKNKSVTPQQFFDLIKMYADKHLVKNLCLNVVYVDEILQQKIINSTVSLHIYRITQEIIQNIIKHSSATKISFCFICNEKLSLQIIDNGKGFEIDKLTRKSGLEHMRERANDIGFNFTITSELSKGTSILIKEK